jgi:hypothetical protein
VIARGGRVFFEEGVPGGGQVVFRLSGQSSVIIDNDSVKAFAGERGFSFIGEGEVPGVSGPGSGSFGTDAGILIDFLSRAEGGFSVNGVEGAISGGSGNPPPFGFFVNGQPATPGTNFFVTRGLVLPSPPPPPPVVVVTDEPPPSFDAQLVSSLITSAQEMTPRKEENAPTKEEKDKKKKDREC